jgi:hypothetical protein
MSKRVASKCGGWGKGPRTHLGGKGDNSIHIGKLEEVRERRGYGETDRGNPDPPLALGGCVKERVLNGHVFPVVQRILDLWGWGGKWVRCYNISFEANVLW